MQYLILPNKKVTLEYYSGILHKDDLIHYKTQICKNVAYNQHYNVIHDFRDATLIAEIEDISSFIDFIKTNEIMYAQKKVAFITNSPKQVTITYLFESLKKEPYIQANTFSTLEGAMIWVGLKSYDIDFLNTMLDELKFDAKS